MSVLASPVVQEILGLNNAIVNGKNYGASLRPKMLAGVMREALSFPEKPEGFNSLVRYLGELSDSICLISGGMDSTIGWYYNHKPKGLYVDVGQPYIKKELDVLVKLGIDYTVVMVPYAAPLETSPWKHIIPGRNMLLLTIAAEMVSRYGSVYFGALKGEETGDRSYNFVTLFEQWYNTVTGKEVNVWRMDQRTKPGWLEWFIKAGHDPNIIRYNTVSCYAESLKPCGCCISCLKKFMAFVNNGIDISGDYEVHPMVGAREHVHHYIEVLTRAKRSKDYSEYPEDRVREDLEAIELGAKWMASK